MHDGTPATGLAPCPRVGHSLTALADPTSSQYMYFLYGGESSSGFLLSDLWAFNRSNTTWMLIAPSNSPPPSRAGHAAAALQTDAPDDTLLVFGGSMGNDVWTYTLTSANWSRLDTFNSSALAQSASLARKGSGFGTAGAAVAASLTMLILGRHQGELVEPSETSRGLR